MTHPSAHRVRLIDQMNAEWRSLGRSPAAVRSLRVVAGRDSALHGLVIGIGVSPPQCPTPFDLIKHLRRASGRARRDEAARLFGVLLRESLGDEMLGRMLVQLLVPGLISVARRLQWGRGGEWRDREEFFGELVTTTWLVVTEWAGQDRPYAVLDLLSAIRCRLRRQLLHAKDSGQRTDVLEALSEDEADAQPACRESELEQLTRLLLDLHREGLGRAQTQVLYARHVLGYTLGEIAAMTGRPRGSLSVPVSEIERLPISIGHP